MKDSNHTEIRSALPADFDIERTGIIVVDHGSRRHESNAMFERIVERFADNSEFSIVEPAHMELATPSIDEAFRRCVTRGADRIVCFPYFLLPGRHWDEDIPRLMAAAAAGCGDVPWLVTAPLGTHPLLGEIISDRIHHCLSRRAGAAEECDVCQGSQGSGCLDNRE